MTLGRTGPELRVRLLGGFEMRLGDVPVRSLDPGAPSRCSPTCCCIGDAPQSRERLAAMLWPDSPGSQARANLAARLAQPPPCAAGR